MQGPWKGGGSDLSEAMRLAPVMAHKGLVLLGSTLISDMGDPSSVGLEGGGVGTRSQRSLGGSSCAEGSKWLRCCGFVVTAVSHD